MRQSSDRAGTTVLLMALGVCQIFILTCIVPLVMFLFLSQDPAFSNLLLVLLFAGLLICVPLGRMYIRAYRNYRRTEVASAAQAILQAKTRPILYLRSFNIDEEMARHQSIVELMFSGLFFYKLLTLEERLVQVLSIIGPVVAVGRPGEKLPTLGAARFYVKEDRWREKVSQISRELAFVVWVSGMTDGLQWELGHLISTVSPEKLIVWAHPHILQLKSRERERVWRAFIDGLGANFLAPLPRRLGDVRAFFFGPSFEPHAVCPNEYALWGAQEDALQTIFFTKGIFRIWAGYWRSSNKIVCLAIGAAASLLSSLLIIIIPIIPKFFFPHNWYNPSAEFFASVAALQIDLVVGMGIGVAFVALQPYLARVRGGYKAGVLAVFLILTAFDLAIRAGTFVQLEWRSFVYALVQVAIADAAWFMMFVVALRYIPYASGRPKKP